MSGDSDSRYLRVATAPTVYGIETKLRFATKTHIIKVATAPTVYGIETFW